MRFRSTEDPYHLVKRLNSISESANHMIASHLAQAEAIRSFWNPIIRALSEDDKTKKPEAFVSSFLTTTKWEECYEECIKPVNGINMWKRCKDVEVLPPPDRIPKGRPPGNKRILESWERAPKQSKKPKRIMTCSNCGGTGHNTQTCQNEAASAPEPAPKRGRGRPKKSVPSQEEISQPHLQSQPNLPVF